MAEEREKFTVINQILPDIAQFIRVVLKQENLSEKAEAWRLKYEVAINALDPPSTIERRGDVVGDVNLSTVALLTSSVEISPGTKVPGTKLEEVVKDHLQAVELPPEFNGYLLRRDDKFRWHRSFCILDPTTLQFSIYTTVDRDNLIGTYLVPQISAHFGPKDCDKEHCFLVTVNKNSCVDGEADSKDSKTSDKIYFAAYSEMELNSWKEHFSLLSRLPSSGDNQFTTIVQSSNPTSSLHPSDLHGMPQKEQSDVTLFNKQSLPLPSLPALDEDNNSDSIIYEELDQLVLQFDATMRATAQAMGQLGQGAKARIKGDPSSVKHGLTLKSKHSLPKSISEDDARDFVTCSSVLLKKNANGSWKKRWCILKRCFFIYYKSQEDKKGHQYVVVGAVVEPLEDAKRQYAFKLACKGVPEMFFAAESKDRYEEWMSSLWKTAESSEFNYDKSVLGLPTKTPPPILTETFKDAGGIYNIPRSLSDASTYDTVPKRPHFKKEIGAERESVYNVPRSLYIPQASVIPPPPVSVSSDEHSPSVNPFELYDVPRSVLENAADEEGIYDEPPDIGDLEIYDYPPDAAEGLESGYSGSRSSVISLDEGSSLSWGADQSWKSATLPPVPTSARPSTQAFRNSNTSSLYDIPRHLVPDQSLLSLSESYGNQPDGTAANNFAVCNQCTMTGYLFKRERFTHWTKMFCMIRNSFLECQKVQGGGAPTTTTTIKLFIPGCQVSPDPDARRQWAFRLKHPRKGIIVQFAAQNESDYKDWLCTLQASTSIEVKPANTIEELRITDLEQNKRWPSSTEKSTTAIPSVESTQSELEFSTRRKTISGDDQDDINSDTLRRKKFAWMKWSNRKLMSSGDVQAGEKQKAILNERSVSLMSLDTLSVGGIQLLAQPHKGVDDDGHEFFQGYLKVQRKGADSLWVRYWCVMKDKAVSCFIDHNDLTLALSVPLSGSTISEANAHRKHSFEISHLESGQCLYFAAESKENYNLWFSEVTNGAQLISAQDQASPAIYQHLKLDVVPGIASTVPMEKGNIFSDAASMSNQSSSSLQCKGELLKFSGTNGWKKYYCTISGGGLHVHYSVFDKTPIFTISLNGCILDVHDVDADVKQTFSLTTSFGKNYVFSALSLQDLHRWMQLLQEYCQLSSQPVTSSQLMKDKRNASPSIKPLKRAGSKSKLKDTDLVSYTPASKLTDATHSGSAEVQFGSGPWQKYWVVLHHQCLYIYQNKTSQSTTKTIVLPGYNVAAAGMIAKRPFVISLAHSCVLSTNIALNDQVEMDEWFSVLERASRLETQEGDAEVAKGNDYQLTIINKELPMVGSASISKRMPSDLLSVGSSQGSVSVIEKKQAIFHQYEKKIKRTQKVSSQTEQRLKQQQSQMQTVKDKLSSVVAKLQEKASTGDMQASQKLNDVEQRLQQVSQILPYLTKYIQVNKQAELQTIAILHESCRMQLNKVEIESTSIENTCTALPNGSSLSGQDKILEQSMQSSLKVEPRQIQVHPNTGNYARVEFLTSGTPPLHSKAVDYAKIDKSLLGGVKPITDEKTELDIAPFTSKSAEYSILRPKQVDPNEKRV